MILAQIHILIWHFICLWEEADIFACTHKPEKGCAAVGFSVIYKAILSLFEFRTNTTTFFKGKNSSWWQKRIERESLIPTDATTFLCVCVCRRVFFLIWQKYSILSYSTSHSIQKIPYYTAGAGIIYSWHFPSHIFFHFSLLWKETTRTNRIESITGR